MTGLIDIIQEFGCVPQDQILDAFGYKRIYNHELLNIVRDRERKLQRHELSVDDFTIKNAVQLLRHLYDRGVRLYLASGTDEEDVKREARILGYDHFFEGRVFGAVGDITKEAKKLVLERILQDIGAESARNIVTFGDGPVEIRETVKRGGFAIGVASDEVKRFGLNAKKRERLIRAGASVIVPDFSQLSSLLSLIGITL
jgi:phosphoglycolate phosphatase-like HAD superfamily hydrolase